MNKKLKRASPASWFSLISCFLWQKTINKSLKRASPACWFSLISRFLEQKTRNKALKRASPANLLSLNSYFMKQKTRIKALKRASPASWYRLISCFLWQKTGNKSLNPARYFFIIMWIASLATLISSPGWTYDWERFKADFISPDGRVIDYYQNQSSHSEGQGYGLLLAVWHQDRETFDRLWKWTRNNLQIRPEDKLLAWSWGERRPGNWTVIDYNNATDGDLCTALALLKADRLWKDPGYESGGLEILQSIRENVILEKGGRLCLLPGFYGFDKGEGVVLNPSYFVYTAFKEFAGYEKPDFWGKVYQDSIEMVRLSLDARMGLPADWIWYDGRKVSIYGEKGTRFGFEAIRNLLFLSWDKNVRKIPKLDEYILKFQNMGDVPLWIDLKDRSMSVDDAPGGFYEVYARAARELGLDKAGQFFHQKAEQKIESEDENYYSRILYLLAKVEFKP